MVDYGIKISKPGYDVKTAATKDLIVFSQAESPKVFHKGWHTTSNYTHDLGYKPLCLAFQSDSTTTPTYFYPIFPESTTTQIIFTTSGAAPVYLVVFYEGIA